MFSNKQGIATQIVNHLTTKGATEEEARQHIYLMDRPGLLVKSLGEGGLSESQLPYAKDDSAWNGIDKKSLLEVVKKVKPNVLIGTSTQAGAFTEEVVREMASHVERPIILPLSNPTRLHEAVPADLLKWTNGRAMVATGSPFHPVDGRPISENNNCFIFPGIGLGAVLSRASSITNGMIAAAVDTLSEMSPVIHDPEGGLLPEVDDIFEISAKIATSVVLQAVKEGVARVGSERSPYTNEPVMVPDSYNNCLRWVKSQMWMPEYRPLRKSSHRW
jgi:malate dehydrogenase (oxaloacetate-decarboxylating)